MKYLSTLSHTMPSKKLQSLLLSYQVSFDFTKLFLNLGPVFFEEKKGIGARALSGQLI